MPAVGATNAGAAGAEQATLPLRLDLPLAEGAEGTEAVLEAVLAHRKERFEMIEEQVIQRRISGVPRAVGGLLRTDRHKKGVAVPVIEGVPRSVATPDGGVNSGHGRPHKASGGPARSGRRVMGRSMESCEAMFWRVAQLRAPTPAVSRSGSGDGIED